MDANTKYSGPRKVDIKRRRKGREKDTYLPTTHGTHKSRGTTTPATHAKENDTHHTPYITLVGGGVTSDSKEKKKKRYATRYEDEVGNTFRPRSMKMKDTAKFGNENEKTRAYPKKKQ